MTIPLVLNDPDGSTVDPSGAGDAMSTAAPETVQPSEEAL